MYPLALVIVRPRLPQASTRNIRQDADRRGGPILTARGGVRDRE